MPATVIDDALELLSVAVTVVSVCAPGEYAHQISAIPRLAVAAVVPTAFVQASAHSAVGHCVTLVFGSAGLASAAMKATSSEPAGVVRAGVVSGPHPGS